MPSIHTSDVKFEIARQVFGELRQAAGNNNLISKAEQGTLAPELQRAADDVRKAQGPNARVTINEAAASFDARVNDGIDAVNQSSGSGKAWLSKAEIEALQQRDPAVGDRAKKAWQLLGGNP
jgi:hypothetical protein